MSIDGVLIQPVRHERGTDEKAPAREPVTGARGKASEGDVIDIKAMKAILYLGLRGDIYLPMEDGHAVDTRA
jgi:hypothetical protein